MLDLTLEPEGAADTEANGERAYRAGRSPRAFGVAERGRPGDKWLMDAARWAWRTRI